MQMTRQTIFLELNELNFDAVRDYCSMGHLPSFARILDKYPIVETTSETEYAELEPWIQWVTAHTGRTLEEHGVFRLGDVHCKQVWQIWEELEQSGLRVGAISPMNAKNQCAKPVFFMPDPWTNGEVHGPFLLKKLYQAASQAVNDNAETKLKISTLFWLALAVARFSRMKSFTRYFTQLFNAFRKRRWNAALILDQLLSDTFITLTKNGSPHFSTLFLNAAAHIQHHYMFNSGTYSGSMRNPDWYVSPHLDPVLEVYSLYDSILADIQTSFPGARLMIATGLHQEPHPKTTFYWRIKEHDRFLRRIGMKFESVEPRMSRDFLIKFANSSEAATGADLLSSAKGEGGSNLFEVDNRGSELFAMLTWSQNIDDQFEFTIGGKAYRKFAEDVAFVAIKNGQHNGVGYFVDMGSVEHVSSSVPLKTIPSLICESFGLSWRGPTALKPN